MLQGEMRLLDVRLGAQGATCREADASLSIVLR